jgi:tetratricopeptide (TPR) repeat protein
MQGKYAEAERILREALAIDEATRGPDHPDTALTLTFLAGCLCQRAKPQLAEVAARRAIAINTTRLGAAHPWTRESERALGCALVGLRRFAEAEPLLLTYMTALETVPGMEGEPDQAAQELADLYAAWGKVEKAAQWRSRLRATR